MIAESEKPRPTDLVMIPYREVECDDTLREFKQVLRFDLVDVAGEPLRGQLLLDRRHKFNRAQSKPVAYFRMTKAEQLIRLANTALAVAVTLLYNEQRRLEPSDDEIRRVLVTHWSLTQGDVLDAVKSVLRDLLTHRADQR